MRWLVVALALLVSHPALACHHYSIWKNPWPQRCSVAHARVPDNAWAVEITKPPPVPDSRTPEQIKESLEHDRAVSEAKEELNIRLKILELEKLRK
jgi:hypothetical protein